MSIDNFYTAPRLSADLIQTSTTSTKFLGTISNRKGFPKDFPADADVQKDTAVFKEHNGMLLMKYMAANDKSQNMPKGFHLLSTKHTATMKNTTEMLKEM